MQNNRITQEQAIARASAHHGYVLIGTYIGRHKLHEFYCHKHNYTQTAIAKNVFYGMRLR